MSEERRSTDVVSVVVAGVVIGVVEVVLAVSFAALVFGGYLVYYLADGIGMYLVAGGITLAVLAIRAGRRGVVGSVQDAAAAVLAVVAASTALDAFGSLQRAFLTVVVATAVVTILTGVTFFLLGAFKLGNLVRFVPYPVVGGFLAGTGWLLFKGGIGVAAGVLAYIRTIGELTDPFYLVRWVPALLFGIVLLLLVRIVKRPIVIPAMLLAAIVLFAVGILLSGNSIQDAREGAWLLGPFASGRLWQPWTFRAVTTADWSAVLGQAAGIATAVFVAVIACLFNVSGIELTLHRDLDSNRELRDAGFVNIISGPFGGIPGYHALSLSALAQQMNVDARLTGLVAALVPLAAVIFGARIVELIPKMLVGGVLVFVGLAFLVEWLWDMRRKLPVSEYLVVWGILLTIVARGILPGVVIGLVLALILFAVNYGKIELVHEVSFGDTYQSNVDRPPGERTALKAMGDRVQILRVNGFVFFGTANGLLERIRKRVEAGSVRYLLIDLRRVTGVDSSAVLSFRKVAQLAEANRFELVFTDAADQVRRMLEQGGAGEAEGIVAFEPDLDRGLQRCEDGLLAEQGEVKAATAVESPVGLPPGLGAYLERTTVPAGPVLIHQGDPSDDLFVLESGRLQVEHDAHDGTRMRLRTIRSGVVVGEVAMYRGIPRTADVVAETSCEVFRLSRASIDRMEAERPELAAALHRWLAVTLAERLSDSQRAFEALLD